MDRGSNKHSPRVDDELAEEVRGIVQGVAGGRAEEWKMAEPPGEDQPEVSEIPDEEEDFGRGEPAGVGNPEAEALSRFGSYIGRSALPGDREALIRSARDMDAPDDVMEALSRLPGDTTFRTVTDVWQAIRRRETTTRRETP
jgi:Protein of unknown function (DUF2795)